MNPTISNALEAIQNWLDNGTDLLDARNSITDGIEHGGYANDELNWLIAAAELMDDAMDNGFSRENIIQAENLIDATKKFC